MKIPGILCAAGCAAVAVLGAQDAAREGQYLAQTVTGSEAVPPGARLRLTCRGPVTVQGVAGSNLSYAMKLRVKASDDDAAARAQLRAARMRIAHQAGYVFLMAPPGPEMTSLQLKVPRGLREVIVSTPEGPIEAYDLEGSLRADTGGGRMKTDRIRGSIALSTAGGDIWLGTIEGNAHCVTGGGPITAGTIRGEAILQTGAGDIAVQEVGGALRASTGAGGVRVTRAGATVVAGTGGGPIQVGRALGMVTLRNSGGPVRVGAASGVSCDNAAGAIDLANVTGALRVSTAMGSIIAQLLAGRPLAESFLSTGRGDITVLIPSNLSVTIRAENELSDSLRRIVSEFPAVAVRMQGGQVVAEGAINGGGPMLRINGNGGTIFIKRKQ